MQNNRPKPIITAIKAIILHTFRGQVGSRVYGSGLRSPTAHKREAIETLFKASCGSGVEDSEP